MTETKATILVVDRKTSLVMELRDESKTSFFEAIGLSTYSNSRAGVLYYGASWSYNYMLVESVVYISSNELRMLYQKASRYRLFG
jgi:hypothetical protein